jgi:hypothetical protein
MGHVVEMVENSTSELFGDQGPHDTGGGVHNKALLAREAIWDMRGMASSPAR